MPGIKGLMDDEMPREKLIKFGPDYLTEVELLAIILRTGTQEKNVLELSREILGRFKINEVSRKTYHELSEFKGIKQAKATQITALFELSRRLSNRAPETKYKIEKFEDVLKLTNSDFQDLKKEKVMGVFVDSKNQVIRKEWLFEGTINFSIVESREVIKKVFDYNANGFFLLHNHPSGISQPSEEDIEITKKINDICQNLNIRFLDHIIIGDDPFSFFQNDYL